jgi:hypothetical protein
MKIRIQIRNSKFSNVYTILSADKKDSYVVTTSDLKRFNSSLVDLLAHYQSRQMFYCANRLKRIIDSFLFVDFGAQA